jgi:hypothetical protein
MKLGYSGAIQSRQHQAHVQPPLNVAPRAAAWGHHNPHPYSILAVPMQHSVVPSVTLELPRDCKDVGCGNPRLLLMAQHSGTAALVPDEL